MLNSMRDIPGYSEIAAVREKLRIRRDPIGWSQARGVIVGDRCRFLGVGPETFGSEPYLVRIGDHVTITSGVRFVTHDGGVWVLRDSMPEIDVFGPIEIGSNVFIGIGAIILPGVTVGDNVVIGAGAVVNRDIPPDCVAAGVPARVVSELTNYRRRSIDKADHTKGMNPTDKRQYLERKFG